GNALQAAILGPGDSEKSEPLVRYLISKGANVNAEAGRYHTALQCAALRCDFNIARILLSHGANVNAEGGQRWTALQAAAYRQNYKLVELLVLEHHANIDACG
ncbi:ankyrin, partial [Wilcoxina mikolae CBS 423.85]